MSPAISFQVREKGVVINLDSKKRFEDIKKELIKHVNKANNFFAGADIYLNITGHRFKLEEVTELIEIIKDYNDINEVYIDNTVENKKTELNNKKTEIKNKKDTLLIERTIRSGQRVKYPTNVVIMGDINPGAVVIAGGDIIVLGKLKGVVHAGADGSYDAKIFAMCLEATQLRIANVISRSPDGNKKSSNCESEIAYLKNGKIIVENYNK
ncbi:MAG: septum site-determining protein MinC [Bacillota bacterium]